MDAAIRLQMQPNTAEQERVPPYAGAVAFHLRSSLPLARVLSPGSAGPLIQAVKVWRGVGEAKPCSPFTSSSQHSSWVDLAGEGQRHERSKRSEAPLNLEGSDPPEIDPFSDLIRCPSAGGTKR